MPTTPSLTQNTSRRVCSAPTCPPSRISSDEGLCSCPTCPFHPASLKARVGRSVLPPPALRLMFRVMEGSVHAQHIHHALSCPKCELGGSVLPPTCPLSRILSDRGLCSCPTCPASLETQVGGSVLPPPALCLAFRVEGFVHSHQALPHLKRELEGPFCPHLPPSHILSDGGLVIPHLRSVH